MGPTEIKILVCGGRSYDNVGAVRRELTPFAKDADNGRLIVVIAGGATGADEIAATEARKRGLHVAEVRAQWSNYGNQAGPLRNQAMLALQPDLVLAFPGGRGTADMVRRAEAAGIPVRKVG